MGESGTAASIVASGVDALSGDASGAGESGASASDPVPLASAVVSPVDDEKQPVSPKPIIRQAGRRAIPLM
jgi:hypothetical protein